MGTATFTKSTVFTIVDCANCHVLFAITQDMEERLRKSGGGFYCPNGHRLSYGKSEADKLKDQVAVAEMKLKETEKRLTWARSDVQHYREAAKTTERRLSATKGVLTRTKNRIADGVCPCCNRHFANLANHMQGKHPDYRMAEESPKKATP